LQTRRSSDEADHFGGGGAGDISTDDSQRGVSSSGLTYRLTIRQGAMWNTNPPRQVTAADACGA
jgi:hypothetical protein